MRQRGFTLIELLITILIIGILASVGVGAYNGQRAKAKNTHAKTTLRTVTQHAWTYGLEHDWNLTGWQAALTAEEPQVQIVGVADGMNPELPGAGRNPNQIWVDQASSPSGVGICVASKGDRVYCSWVQNPNDSDPWAGMWTTSLANTSVGDTYWQDQSSWQRWSEQKTA